MQVALILEKIALVNTGYGALTALTMASNSPIFSKASS